MKEPTLFSKIVLWILIIGAIFFMGWYMSGCAPSQTHPMYATGSNDTEITRFEDISNLKRFVDEEYGIVCYIKYDRYISCIRMP